MRTIIAISPLILLLAAAPRLLWSELCRTILPTTCPACD